MADSAAPPAAGKSKSRLRWAILSFVIMADLLAVGVSAVALHQSRIHYETRSAIMTENLSQVLTHDLVSSIDKIDVALQSIADDVSAQIGSNEPDVGYINALLQGNRQRLPEVSALRVANADGNAVFGVEDPPAFDTYLNDNSYFFNVRTPPHKGLLISKPLLSRIDNSWMIVLARRINQSDGSRAGLVYAGIRIEHFNRQFAALDIGRQGVVFLQDSDFDLVTSHPKPGAGAPPFDTRSLIRSYGERIFAVQNLATFRTPAAVDALPRIYSVRKAEGYPFQLGVGLGLDETLAPWWREVAQAGSIVGTFCLITLILGWQGWQAWNRQNRAVESLRKSEETLRMIEENVSDVISRIDPRGRYRYVSPAVTDATGYAESELIGRNVIEFLHPDDADAIDPRHPESPASLGNDRMIYRFRHKNGHYLWVEACTRAVRDSEGALVEYVIVSRDITERKNAERQIEFLAYHDTLTELPNRLLAQDRLRQAMAHADRTHTKVALLFFDLDRFKTVNDSLGHNIGDGLLKGIAKRLRECVRDSDTISRQGGDEFLLILRDLHGAEAAGPVLTKINERLQAPFLLGEHELRISASIGVALYPDDGSDFDTLLKKADIAMYRAKDAGRNTYSFFDPEMNAEAVEHLDMHLILHRALERQQFSLHYQPQLDLKTGHVVGTEALIRWHHPEQGLISPDRFIPIAEGNGLIVPIGEWVIREACRQAAAWQKEGMAPFVMAVNLSGVQFARGNVEQTVLEALKDSGLAAEYLELELTESIFIRNTESVLGTVKRLKSIGVKLSIDDFGTGYSSLAYLKRFEVDKLKIDRTFIRDLTSDPDDAAIVRTIIQMARNLGLRTIAEGVETEEVIQHLRGYRCDEAQGYYYARPMPPKDFATFMAERAPTLCL